MTEPVAEVYAHQKDLVATDNRVDALLDIVRVQFVALVTTAVFAVVGFILAVIR